MLRPMSDQDAEIERLKIEVESLRARLIVAKASTAKTVRRELTSQQLENARLGTLLYLRDKASAAGFDGSTEAGLDAYREAEKRRVKAWARAEAAKSPAARASILRTLGAAYLEPDEAEPAADGVSSRTKPFAEPAPAFNLETAVGTSKICITC